MTRVLNHIRSIFSSKCWSAPALAAAVACVGLAPSLALAGRGEDRGDRYRDDRGRYERRDEGYDDRRDDRRGDSIEWQRRNGILPRRDERPSIHVDVDIHRPHRPVQVYEDRVTKVWVEPVYRTVTDRVWREPVYRTVTDRVWVEPVVREECERVWVPDRWEVRDVVRYECGVTVVTRQRVLVEPGHFEMRPRPVVMAPGRWECVERQELVCEGRWEFVERQELVCPGRWEMRTERVPVLVDRHDHRGGWEVSVGGRL